MRAVVECIHDVNLRDTCPECEALLEEGSTCRAVWTPHVIDQLDALERNQVPSSFHEALSSGDGSYRP